MSDPRVTVLASLVQLDITYLILLTNFQVTLSCVAPDRNGQIDVVAKLEEKPTWRRPR